MTSKNLGGRGGRSKEATIFILLKGILRPFSAKNIEIDFVLDPRPLQPQTTLYDLKRPRTTSNDLGGHAGQT